MSDILNFLRSYPDDPAAVMSKARVAEVIAEIERLRAELAAANNRSLENYERWARDGEEAEARECALRCELATERERVAAYQAHIIRCDNSLKQYQAERDALRAELAAMKTLAYDRLLQVEAAEAERDKLREALEPFAARLAVVEEVSASKYAVSTNIDIEYLRRARAALNKGGGDE